MEVEAEGEGESVSDALTAGVLLARTQRGEKREVGLFTHSLSR